MRAVTRVLILAGVAVLAACASQAPATSTTAGAGQSATATQAAATNATTTKIPTGYTREVVNGSEMYCRDDLDTGSRVQRTKVCLTWEQLQAQERSKIDVTRGSSPLD